MITVISSDAALIKMVLESQCMLKLSSSGSNTGVQTLPPLVNCIVNDALLHASPHVNQTSLQVVHILDFCLVDTLRITLQMF